MALLSKTILEYMAQGHGARFQLNNPAWRVLSIIEKHQPIYPSVISKYSSLDPYNVTRIVDRLVELGMVSRKGDAADRRRIVLRLSKHGSEVFHELDKEFDILDQHLRSLLTGIESEHFDHALVKLQQGASELLQSVPSCTQDSSTISTSQNIVSKVPNKIKRGKASS